MISSRIRCLVIMCLVIVLMGVNPCQAAPKVQVDQTVHDAGKVPEGTEVGHEFRFRNTGDQVLVIKPKAC